ncbi:hypothetical protein SASPL_102500 [Salvia splendens]|uniref:Uncharacterized protein n=1 Tax=Salvia splendens TaxID=180675 RepID=A0A8X8YWD0_SALSN|nr:uncharacterized protein At4g00950-like [Salvia splendens]KAG6437581.1 hypothetical protein SASPL_102500 [Salvia splendens]
MGEESENEACFPTLKLPFAEIPDSPEHPSTPPFQASATIPFQWEEQPGKPRPCSDIITRPKPAKSLELPPCMSMNPADKFTKTPSPTTVLEGPYSVGRPKFSSFRFFREGHDSLVSPEAAALLGAKKSGKARGLFGKFKGGAGGSCRFSPSTVSSCSNSEDLFANNCGVKINRNGSFSNLSHAKPSQLWTSFCHGIKQIMHWKGRKKSNKEGRHSRVDNVS